MFVIRLRERNLELSAFLVELLQSAIGRDLLLRAMQGGTNPVISAPRLRELSLPMPQLGVIDLIEHIRSVETDLLTRIQQAQRIRGALFSSADPEQFASMLRSLSTEAQVLRAGLLQVDDPIYRIRNFYPFPIAYNHRTLDGTGSPKERHDRLLKVAENLYSFLVSAGLAIAAHTGILRQTDDSLLKAEGLRQNYWRTGLSLGDWIDLGKRIGKEIRKVDSAGSRLRIADDYPSIWFKGRGTKVSAFTNDAERIVQFRNDAHHRPPDSDAEYENAARELDALLSRAYQDLDWFIDYPMRKVNRVDQSWANRSFMATTELFTGDHPVHQMAALKIPTSLPTGHLYLEADEDNWISLYPLITVNNCTRCGRPETFLVDTWAGAGHLTRLKSFERGHVLAVKDTKEVHSDAASAVSHDLSTWLSQL